MDAPAGAIVHIAGMDITVNDRYLRQRCGWCGAVLMDYDLTTVGVMLEPCPDCAHKEPQIPPCPRCLGSRQIAPRPGGWPPGAMVEVDGGVSFVIEAETLPDNACAMLDPAVTK